VELRLSPQASVAFRRLWQALDASNARLADGKHVGQNRAHVVRWVFERIAAAIEVQATKSTQKHPANPNNP
jgi:hypothetical protein